MWNRLYISGTTSNKLHHKEVHFLMGEKPKRYLVLSVKCLAFNIIYSIDLSNVSL